MSSIPALKPQEVIKILQRLGFHEVRQRGSHKQFRHSDGRGTTVPFHGGRDVSPYNANFDGKMVTIQRARMVNRRDAEDAEGSQRLSFLLCGEFRKAKRASALGLGIVSYFVVLRN